MKHSDRKRRTDFCHDCQMVVRANHFDRCLGGPFIPRPLWKSILLYLGVTALITGLLAGPAILAAQFN